MACWTEYLEQLFMVDLPSRQLQTVGLQMLDADPSIDKTAPKEAVAKFGCGKAAGMCNISAVLLKAGGLGCDIGCMLS